MKIQRFYSSIDQKIDFCQDHLLTDPVPFRAYYAKNASRDMRLVLSENVTYIWKSRKDDVPNLRFIVVVVVCYETVGKWQLRFWTAFVKINEINGIKWH